MSLYICGLMWTSATLSVHPTMLEIGVLGVVLVEIDEISIFSSFGVKLAIVDHIYGAVIVVDGAGEFEEVMDGIGEEKTVLLCSILLVVAPVVPIIVFFLFSKSTGDHNMAMQVE